MPIDFHRPRWLAVVAVCLLAAVYSWFYFPSAFPILEIEISMDRGEALRRAKKQVEKLNLGPPDYRQAANFSHDRSVQNFVELEAGGKDTFRKMIRADRYQPYQWHVRHYQPNKTREATVRLTPDGRLYGFKEKWPEAAAGPALDSEAARKIAEEKATEKWNVELNKYELISTGNQKRPSGRVDHTFTYERKNISLGEGNYRLRLGVSGDRLSEVTYFVKVPEGFSRRYENMRSANSLIQNTGSIFVYVGYLFIGCLLGAFWLLRRDALCWRTALVWGAALTVLMFLAHLNSLPLQWMSYDTAVAPGSFLSQQLVQALSSALLFGVFITLSFVTAEGLSRQAFGHHPKLWRLWNPRAAGSRTVSSLTLLGYCLVGPYFAYNVALYSFGQSALGWWTPSSLLFEPNILAHYVTWLQPVVNALRAGFWEECLFRALPLAAAALLGSRFGRRKWWIGVALVLQALVFGAGHAAYATQPAYARVVELFFSSLAMGGIFLAWGLLPAVLIHFLYDIILMALPLFVASAAGIWFSQSVVVLVALVPVFVVLYGYYQNGGWSQLPEKFYNRAGLADRSAAGETASFPVPPGLSWTQVVAVGLAGLVGVGLWLGWGNFKSWEVPLEMTRDQAEQAGQKLLQSTGEQPEKWLTTASVTTGDFAADAFVWQNGDTAAYEQLMGSYLHGPYWVVRFISFRGSVAERAEEYQARLAPGEGLREIQHYLPEAAPGDSLPASRARALADSVVLNQIGQEPTNLKRISASPTPRPNRRDWTFVYGNPEAYPLEKGEARLSVTLLGSEVTDTSRYIHVPENWRRQRRDRQTVLNTIRSTARPIIYLFMLGGALVGLVCWGRGKQFSGRAALAVGGLYLLLVGLKTANSWPTILAGLNTAEPYWNQITITLLQRIRALFTGGIFALVAGYVHGQLGTNKTGSLRRSVVVGLGLAALGVGLATLAGYFAPSLSPRWGGYGALDQLLPWLHQSLEATSSLLSGSLLLLLFATVQHRWSRAGRKHNVFTVLGLALFGLVVASHGSYSHLLEWGLKSLFFAGLFTTSALYILPNDRSFVPLAMAGVLGFQQVEHLLTAAHPYAPVGATLAIVVLLAAAGYWTRTLQRSQIQV